MLHTAVVYAVPPQEFDFSTGNIDYSVIGELPESTDVDELIDTSGNIIVEMLAEMGVENVYECSTRQSLIIGYLTWPRLNQLREAGYFGESYISFEPIRAITVFDTIKYDGTVIFISNSLRAYKQTDITLVHEITHYWWIRLCLDNVIRGMTPEEFALAAERKMAALIVTERN
jgi:hypothetical protein